MNSYLSKQELQQLGLKSFGENVLISRKASIYKPEVISLGSNVRIDDFCILSGGNGIKIGNFIHIAPFSGLYGGGEIEIHDFAGLSSRCSLYSESDDYSGKSLTNPTVPMAFKPTFASKKIILQRHTLVGVNSTILPGVTMYEGSVCGAHSLATKDLDKWGIYFGTPAKRIKTRDNKLLKLEGEFLSWKNSEG